jgi:hypothetical protein
MDVNSNKREASIIQQGAKAIGTHNKNCNINGRREKGTSQMFIVHVRRETGKSMDARISRDSNSSTSISRDANSTVWTPTSNEFSWIFMKN